MELLVCFKILFSTDTNLNYILKQTNDNRVHCLGILHNLRRPSHGFPKENKLQRQEGTKIRPLYRKFIIRMKVSHRYNSSIVFWPNYIMTVTVTASLTSFSKVGDFSFLEGIKVDDLVKLIYKIMTGLCLHYKGWPMFVYILGI